MNTGGAFASAWIPAESDRMRKFRDTSGLLGTTISPSRNGQSKLFFSPAVCTTSAVRLGLGFRQHLWRHGGHTPQKSHEFSDARPPENVYSPPPPCMYTIGGCPPEPRPAPVQSSVHAEHDHLVFSKTVYYPVYNRPLQPYMTNLSAPWVLRPIPRTRPAPGKCIQPPPPLHTIHACPPVPRPILCLCRAMQSTSEHDHLVFSKTIHSKATVVYAAYMTSISAPVDFRPRSTEPAANVYSTPRSAYNNSLPVLAPVLSCVHADHDHRAATGMPRQPWLTNPSPCAVIVA